jgi:hypothetical protein
MAFCYSIHTANFAAHFLDIKRRQGFEPCRRYADVKKAPPQYFYFFIKKRDKKLAIN